MQHSLPLAALATATLLVTATTALPQSLCSCGSHGPNSSPSFSSSSTFLGQSSSLNNNVIPGPSFGPGPGPVSTFNQDSGPFNLAPGGINNCGSSSSISPSPPVPVPTSTQINSGPGLSGVPALSGIVVDSPSFQRLGPPTPIQTPPPVLLPLQSQPQLPASFPTGSPCQSHIMTIPRRSESSSSINFISTSNAAPVLSSNPVVTTTTTNTNSDNQPSNSIFIRIPEPTNTNYISSPNSPCSNVITNSVGSSSSSNAFASSFSDQQLSNFVVNSIPSSSSPGCSGPVIFPSSNQPSNTVIQQINQPATTSLADIPVTPSTTFMSPPGTTTLPSFGFVSSAPPAFAFSTPQSNNNPSFVSVTPLAPSPAAVPTQTFNSFSSPLTFSPQSSGFLYAQSTPVMASYPATVLLPTTPAVSYSSPLVFNASPPPPPTCSSPTPPASSIAASSPPAPPANGGSNSFTITLPEPPPVTNIISSNKIDNGSSSPSVPVPTITTSSSDSPSKDSPLTYTLLTSSTKDGAWPSSADSDCSVPTSPPFN